SVFLHERIAVAAHQVCAGEIHTQDAIPVIQRRLLERPPRADTGAIDQNVDGTELASDVIDALTYLMLVRDVAVHRHAVPMERLQPLQHALSVLGIMAMYQ